jgi:hypothetical protein
MRRCRRLTGPESATARKAARTIQVIGLRSSQISARRPRTPRTMSTARRTRREKGSLGVIGEAPEIIGGGADGSRVMGVRYPPLARRHAPARSPDG